MALDLAIERSFALVFGVLALSLLAKPKDWRDMARCFRKPRELMMFSMFGLFFCGLMLCLHPGFETGPAAVVSCCLLLGVVKSASFLILPEWMTQPLMRLSESLTDNSYRAAGVFYLGVAIYVGRHCF